MGAAFCAIVYFAGPIIEGHLFPIIEATHVARSVRYVPGEDDICWSVHFRKFRNDAPAYFNYRIVFQGPQDARYPDVKLGKSRVPLPTYRLNEDGSRVFLSSYGFAHHREDQEWTSQYCADIPSGLNLNTPFTIEGEGYYDTPHHLWFVPQELPTFVVPGIETIKEAPGAGG